MERLEDVDERWQALDETFYCYPKYKPRSYTASAPLRDWLNQGILDAAAEEAKIPLLANIAVDVSWVLENQGQ